MRNLIRNNINSFNVNSTKNLNVIKKIKIAEVYRYMLNWNYKAIGIKTQISVDKLV